MPCGLCSLVKLSSSLPKIFYFLTLTWIFLVLSGFFIIFQFTILHLSLKILSCFCQALSSKMKLYLLFLKKKFYFRERKIEQRENPQADFYWAWSPMPGLISPPMRSWPELKRWCLTTWDTQLPLHLLLILKD